MTMDWRAKRQFSGYDLPPTPPRPVATPPPTDWRAKAQFSGYGGYGGAPGIPSPYPAAGMTEDDWLAQLFADVYGDGEAGGYAPPAWSGTREAAELGEQWGREAEERQWGRTQEVEGMRWEQEQRSIQAEGELERILTNATNKMQMLRQIIASVVPRLVSTGPEGYMQGFGPGEIGERMGIPPLQPARFTPPATPEVGPMNWREMLGG